MQRFGAAWQGAVAANITPDREAGLGAWTDDEIKRAFREGVSRDGRRLNPPMGFAFYAGLTDGDAADIVAYLRTPRPPMLQMSGECLQVLVFARRLKL